MKIIFNILFLIFAGCSSNVAPKLLLPKNVPSNYSHSKRDTLDFVGEWWQVFNDTTFNNHFKQFNTFLILITLFFFGSIFGKVINKYILPATIKISIGLKVVDIINLATPVKSIKVTVLAKEVPLSISIISLL